MAARWRRFQLGEDQAQLPNGVFGRKWDQGALMVSLQPIKPSEFGAAGHSPLNITTALLS
jgi:hypothetical protein